MYDLFLFVYRIGFVFILSTKEEIDGNEDAGIALWRTFNYIAEESDTSQAFTSIINVSSFTRNHFFFSYLLLFYIVRILLPCDNVIHLHLITWK